MNYTPHTGLQPDPVDERDFSYAPLLAMGAHDIDWERGFSVYDELGIKPESFDQGSSSSCVAQATAAHIRVWLKRLLGMDDDWSRRFIYSHISLGRDAGAYLRDGVKFAASVGSVLERLIPSYIDGGLPPSESFMLSKDGITEQILADAKKWDKFTYRMIPGGTDDIGLFAHAIRNNGGVVGGFVGSNAGWLQPKVRPPQGREVYWGHAVFLSGYGMYEGEPCLFTRNSWGGRYTIRGGRWEGYQAIPVSYFTAAMETAAGLAPGAFAYNSWVLVPEEVLPPDIRIMDILKKSEGKLVQDVQGSGAFGIVINGTVRVASPERLAALCMTYLMRNGAGVGLPKSVWDVLPKQEF